MECQRVDRFRQIPEHLLDVHPGGRRGQAVIQHAVLKRSEWIDGVGIDHEARRSDPLYFETIGGWSPPYLISDSLVVSGHGRRSDKSPGRFCRCPRGATAATIDWHRLVSRHT